MHCCGILVPGHLQARICLKELDSKNCSYYFSPAAAQRGEKRKRKRAPISAAFLAALACGGVAGEWALGKRRGRRVGVKRGCGLVVGVAHHC